MTDEQVKCVVCEESTPVSTGVFDAQLNGITCPCCQKNIMKAVAWMRHAGISRPVLASDINQWNHKRFML